MLQILSSIPCETVSLVSMVLFVNGFKMLTLMFFSMQWLMEMANILFLSCLLYKSYDTMPTYDI